MLENGFTNIRDMIRVLYPQRWLPYRYLGPFVFDQWDARAAAASDSFPRDLARRAMVVVSDRDEIVPPAMGKEIFGALRASGETHESGERGGGGGIRLRPVGRLVVLEGALHEDAWRYREWTRAVKQYLEDLESETK